MIDIVTAAAIAKIARPLTQALVDKWIAPKIEKWGKKWMMNKKFQDHFFSNKFKEYLNIKYEECSVINVLSLKREVKFLEEIYLPLGIYKSKSIIRSITDGLLRSKSNFDKNSPFIIDNSLELFKSHSKVVIVDAAGMGKSTIVKKLFLLSVNNNFCIPILVELRRLSKNRKIVDEIFSELKLINEEVDKEFILELISRGDFFFFLDGYDEIQLSDRKAVTEDIDNFTKKAGKNKFLITSRPDDSLYSLKQFEEFKIKNLTKEEAYLLLTKYDNSNEISKLLIEKLRLPENASMDEFLTNPLLTSLLFTAFEFKRKIPFKKHLFYRQVYDALFEAHDLIKGESFEREKFSDLSYDEFDQILRYIAFICLKYDRIEFSKDKILQVIQKAKNRNGNLKFQNSDLLKDLLMTVPLFIKSGLYYTWSHKSIFEYFAALFICNNSRENCEKILSQLVSVDYLNKNFNLLVLYASMDIKTFDKCITINVIKNYIEFVEEVESKASRKKELNEFYFKGTYSFRKFRKHKSRRNGESLLTFPSKDYFIGFKVNRRYPERKFLLIRKIHPFLINQFITNKNFGTSLLQVLEKEDREYSIEKVFDDLVEMQFNSSDIVAYLQSLMIGEEEFFNYESCKKYFVTLYSRYLKENDNGFYDLN